MNMLLLANFTKQLTAFECVCPPPPNNHTIIVMCSFSLVGPMSPTDLASNWPLFFTVSSDPSKLSRVLYHWLKRPERTTVLVSHGTASLKAQPFCSLHHRKHNRFGLTWHGIAESTTVLLSASQKAQPFWSHMALHH